MADSGGGKPRLEVWDPAFTKGVCDVLAQTDSPGLTNSEIDVLLAMVRITTREPGANKRDSLYRTLHNTQVRQRAGNVLVAFLTRAMSPARYASNPDRFADLAGQLNEFLVHYGYRIGDDGRLHKGMRAHSLSEAAQLAGRLHTELERRKCHSELFRYCSEELLARSLFHATNEAAKSLPARVRALTGLAGDGSALYNGALGTNTDAPLLYINLYRTDSDVSEHRGFKQILLGVHGHYRNPRAHTTRLGAQELEQDFFDAFSLFSYLHRRLDLAQRAPLDP